MLNGREIWVDKQGKKVLGGIFQQKYVLSVMNSAWNVPEYWKQSPTLPVSRLKQELDKLIRDRFQTDVRISHEEIYDFLAERGFMPCNLYAFLTGFLFKEYAIMDEEGVSGETHA